MAKVSKCDAALSPGSLEWCEGTTVAPGIRPRLYYIPRSDIVKFPTLPDTLGADDSMGKLAIYPGSFKLKAGKFFKFIDINADKSPVTVEVQGEKPAKTFINRATLVCANTDEDAAGFSRLANNSNYIYLVQEKKGKFRVIGNDMYQTNTDATLNLGASPTDSDAGMNIEISCTDICHMPFYTGEIMVAEGEDANAPEPVEPAPGG